MGKKQGQGKDPETVYNPYFGKANEASHMPKRPLFTWILVIPGLGLGLWLGLGTGDLLMGLICGAVFGIAGGSLIDKWREKRHGDKGPKD